MTTPTLTPAPSSNEPHGYKSWSRGKKIAVWAGGIFGAFAIIGMISNAVSPPKPASLQPHVTVTHSAPAKPAAAPKPAPVVTHTVTAAPKPAPKVTVTVTHTAAPASAPAPAKPAAPAAAAPDTMADWCTGLGAADMAAVKTDVGQMSTDASNYNLTAVEADGTQLETDAATASANPPPVSSAQQAAYTQAMQSLMTAGIDADTGDFTDAASALDTGTGYFSQDQGILPAGCTS